MNSFSIKDELMKLNKACPWRRFFFNLNPLFDLLSQPLSLWFHPGLDGDSLSAISHSGLALGRQTPQMLPFVNTGQYLHCLQARPGF